MKLEGLVKYFSGMDGLFSNFCVFAYFAGTGENEVDFSFHVTFTERARMVKRVSGRELTACGDG